MNGQARHQPEPSTQEVLAGLVERVTFHNDENGFCVLRAKARGHRDLVTVVGHAATISAGEWITASGEWVNDHTHGSRHKDMRVLNLYDDNRLDLAGDVARLMARRFTAHVRQIRRTSPSRASLIFPRAHFGSFLSAAINSELVLSPD